MIMDINKKNDHQHVQYLLCARQNLRIALFLSHTSVMRWHALHSNPVLQAASLSTSCCRWRQRWQRRLPSLFLVEAFFNVLSKRGASLFTVESCGRITIPWKKCQVLPSTYLLKKKQQKNSSQIFFFYTNVTIILVSVDRPPPSRYTHCKH